MLCGSWSVLVCERGIERTVEMVGVGDDTREGGSDEGSKRGDEEVDVIVWGKLTDELFGA